MDLLLPRGQLARIDLFLAFLSIYVAEYDETSAEMQAFQKVTTRVCNGGVFRTHLPNTREAYKGVRPLQASSIGLIPVHIV